MIAAPPLFSESPAARAQFRTFIEQLVSRHTLRAYLTAVQHFSDWCSGCAIEGLMAVDAEAARTYAEVCAAEYSASTVKQRIVCLRKLFEALSQAGFAAPGVFERIAAPKKAKQHPAVTVPSDAVLLRLIDTGGATMIALRDRALLALMSTSFVPMRTLCVLPVRTFARNRKNAWLVFGGDKVSCPPRLASYMESYLDAGGLRLDEDAYLFRSIAGASGHLTERPLTQPDVYRIVRRRAEAAGVGGKLGPRDIRAAGLVRFLRCGGSLELARKLAGHATSRTTVIYAPPGTRRPRNRIAYRFADLDEDWDDLVEDDYAGWWDMDDED
jgi:site-specific recombinase XerD